MSFSRFFSNVQEADWYRSFLQPVIEEIPAKSTVLDIGTGPAKLLQILVQEKNADCTGIDIDAGMLAEARTKLAGTSARLFQINTGSDLPFEDNSFDEIFFCNVLFNLSPEAGLILLQEASRVLKPDGKIIILTPSGVGKLADLPRNLFRPANYSFGIWYLATRRRAKAWTTNSYLKEFCESHALSYAQNIVFNGFANLEIIEKQ